MLISQIRNADGSITVAVRENGGAAHAVKGASSVHALALEAANSGRSLKAVVEAHGLGDAVDLEKVYAEGRFLPPITHADPAHLHLTGTGLTHLGSASTRDAMHAAVSKVEEGATDTMKMFKMGLEGGKPKAGETGVQPEWFYKGNGTQSAAPGGELVSPSFALDGGEEPEMAGIYVIADNGQAFRIGFAVSNEFSDHVTERINYLYLAHSKLRPASFGPEIRVGDAAGRYPRHLAHHPQGRGFLGKAVPVGRSQYVPYIRQSGVSPLQIRNFPCTGRCACPYVRDGHAVLR